MTSREKQVLNRAVEILDAEFAILEDGGHTIEEDYYMDMVGEALASLSEVLDQLRTR